MGLLIWRMLVLLHIVLVLELCDLHGGLRYLTSKANQLTYGKFHKFRKFPGWSFYEHQCIENATKHIMVFYQIEQNPNRSSLYIKAEVSAGLRKSWKTSYKNYKAGGPATIYQS